jgi:hypothetical protein
VNDSTESSSAQDTPARWLLLIHHLPPTPHYLRVKVRRRLARIGAVALKNSVYALPATDEAAEDFEWLCGEIEAAGGTALLCESRLLHGVTDRELQTRLRRLAPARRTSVAPRSPVKVVPGTTWVTRADVHVDRIASAWLIRRFIDPMARFRFVPARGYPPRRGELRFDMYDAEFTHEGDRCTFEVLVARFCPGDTVLPRLAQVIHDIDCKDAKFKRRETAGVRRQLQNLIATTTTDRARLRQGAALFDALYAVTRPGRA